MQGLCKGIVLEFPLIAILETQEVGYALVIGYSFAMENHHVFIQLNTSRVEKGVSRWKAQKNG